MTIKIERRGETLDIHEDALEQHEAAGWRQVADSADETANEAAAETPRRARKPRADNAEQ